MPTQVRRALRTGVAATLRKVVFPGRDRVATVAEGILGENPGRFVVSLREGGKLIVDGVTDSSLFYLGGFDWNVGNFLAKKASSGSVVFDVGANIGVYTIPLAIHVGHRGKVYAFEALRQNYEILVENIALNKLTNVTAVFGAVTDSTGIREAPRMLARPRFMGNYSLASESSSRSRIPSWALDDFAAGHGINHVDLMKMDIEGSETMALRGARTLFLTGKIRTALCEVNPYWLPRMGSSPQELYETFETFGMDAFLLTRLARLKRIDKDFCLRSRTRFDAVFRRRASLSA